MKVRLRKSQIKELIHKQAPDYLELFNEFNTYDGGWLIWPEHLLKIKHNLKLDNYVTLYDDEKKIKGSASLILARCCVKNKA